MNRLIVDLLADVVGFVAIAIVVIGGVIGYRYGLDAGDNLTATTGFGLVVGLIVALCVCGLLSSLVLIENHLRYVADDIDALREAELGDEGDLDNVEAAEAAAEAERKGA